MRFLYPKVSIFDGAELVCRHGRLIGTLGLGSLSVIFVATVPIWLYLQAGALICGGCALLAIIAISEIFPNIRALYKKTNWVLAADHTGLWLNLQSYRDVNCPEAATVLRLEYAEIEGMRCVGERYDMPDSDGGDRSGKSTCLLIDLRNADGEEIARMQKGNRVRQTASRRVFFGLIGVNTQLADSPVTVSNSRQIRVLWRADKMVSVVPSLHEALPVFARHVNVDQPVQSRQKGWRDLSPDELQDFAKRLADNGDRISAARLLVQRTGCTLGEARQKVEQLVAHPPAPTDFAAAKSGLSEVSRRAP